MKRIRLTQNKYALVDDADYRTINHYTWHYHHSGYAARNKKHKGKYKFLSMHRHLIKCPKGMIIDHINGNGLDNQRSNLRIVTNQQNRFNSNKHVTLSSRYKGVYWKKNQNKYAVSLRLNQKLINVGTFQNEHHAAMAYDIWAKELFGEYARFNFPNALTN